MMDSCFTRPPFVSLVGLVDEANTRAWSAILGVAITIYALVVGITETTLHPHRKDDQAVHPTT